ncbi:PIH1 domain-containing protein 1-like [Amphiura filiformis]|uniref:PIH1 domain-containing protein 1-like n=1 Tax=Amphiura filiformis TaxID=82378 RepID=UPI003B226D05
MAAYMNVSTMSTNSKSDKSLLVPDEEIEGGLQDALYKQLLLQAAEAGHLDLPGNEGQEPISKLVTPEPGFCVKTKDDQGNKIFVNICKTEHMPAPKDISDEDLVKLLQSDEPDFRVPLSIGEPHAEVDKGGKGCTAYDIAINSEFYNKIGTSDLFKGFFMSVVIEGLENKYNILLDKNWIQLKNKKCHGVITEHNIRTKSKPRISEVGEGSIEPENPSLSSSTTIPASSKPLITELESSSVVTSKAPQPEYVIMREPLEGHPEFLVAEIKLPKVKSAKLLTLDLGEDRIVLHAHPSAYYLDIYLPFYIMQEDSGAQFNRDTKVLTLTLPVKPL